MKKTIEKFNLDKMSKNSFISFSFSGKKPMKENLSENPLSAIAVVIAEALVWENIILFLIHSLTKILPGSEIPGVPASETNEII